MLEQQLNKLFIKTCMFSQDRLAAIKNNKLFMN